MEVTKPVKLRSSSLVVEDMLARKVDIDLSSLYPEFSSKNQDDLFMEVTRRVVTWDRGSVVDMKLSMLASMFCFLVIPSEVEVKQVLGFHKEIGPRGICSKELSLIMVVYQGLGQIATPNPWIKCRLKIRNIDRSQ